MGSLSGTILTACTAGCGTEQQGNPKGSASEAADKPFGISNSKSQITNLKFEIWDLRFRAKRGWGPSAAAEGALREGASPSKSWKGRCGRPSSEGSPEARNFGCKQ